MKHYVVSVKITDPLKCFELGRAYETRRQISDDEFLQSYAFHLLRHNIGEEEDSEWWDAVGAHNYENYGITAIVEYDTIDGFNFYLDITHEGTMKCITAKELVEIAKKNLISEYNLK